MKLQKDSMSISVGSLWFTAGAAALAFCAIGEIAALAQKPGKVLTDKVDRLVKPLIDSDSISALSLGFVDGDKTYVMNFGQLSKERPISPTSSTIYEIGSITKVFTGTVLADMVEHKDLALSDPVQKYLPKNANIPQYDGTPITLMDLATQSSGLPSLPSDFNPKDPNNPYKDYTFDMLYAFLSSYKLTRKPGEKYEYSNLGVGLLGDALAHHAGMSYEALVKQSILSPLQMNESGITLTPEMRANLAPGHDPDGEPAANWDLDTFAGAGALRSSVNDMLRFLQASLGLSQPALQPAIMLAQKAERSIEGPGHIGLCWHILPDGNVTWHNGGTGGYRTMLALNRSTHRGVVLLCNTANDAITPLGFALMRVLSGENVEPLTMPSVVKLDPAIYEHYVGSYELKPGAVLAVTRSGDHLMAQLTGQSAHRIYPSAEKEFFFRAAPATVTFETDGKGAITGLVLHQNGANIPAKKII